MKEKTTRSRTASPRQVTDASSPEAQLRSIISRLSPPRQKLVGAARVALRKRFPTANELAYDYPKQVVIAYGPNDRGIDAVVSLAAHADGVDLHLNNGPALPDPKQLLQGAGKMTRFVRLDAASRIGHADVRALIDAAVELMKIPMPATGVGSLIVKSNKSGAAKKRPAPKKKK